VTGIRSSVKDRYLKSMRNEQFHHSPLGRYLTWMRQNGENGAEDAKGLEADIIETFTTDAGLRVLKLFEKSTLFSAMPNGTSDGALREENAVRNFILELRRLVSNG
jgi:hypothetical protein